MTLNKRFIGSVSGVILLVISMGIGLSLAYRSTSNDILAVSVQARNVPEGTQLTNSQDNDRAGVVETQEQNPTDEGVITIDPSQNQKLIKPEAADVWQNQAGITVDQARAVVEAVQPDASIVKTELGNENGLLVYSIELDDGQKIKVDAGNGSILYIELLNNKPEDQTNQRAASQNGTGISADEAIAIAEKAFDGAKAVEVEQESENGGLVYEVEMDNGAEVEVDGSSGDILEIEHEDDDQEAEDDADEDD